MSGDFESTASSIMALGMYGTRPGRDIMRDMLSAYGHPERGFDLIHIAGTNGKGSVAFFLAKLLEADGHRVGLYTSPHLIKISERIRVCGMPVSDDDLVRISSEYISGKDVTASDVLLLTALKYFNEKQCDQIIIETGLGGSLDSTNALTDADMGGPAILTMITRIGYDHTEFLGDTIEEIAAEKSGIIKPGTKVVISDNTASAMKVITARCTEVGVSWVCPSDDDGLLQEIDNRLPDLAKTYQRENIASAVAGARMLGVKVSWGALRESLFPGRFNIIRNEPLIIVDGAHNPDGASALAVSVAASYPGRRFDCIIGIVKDKDAKGIIEPMLSLMKSAVVVETGSANRRTDGAALIGILKEHGVPCIQKGNLAEALESLSGRDMLIFGSLYLAGEAITLI